MKEAVAYLNKAGAAGVIADLEKEKRVVNLKEGTGHARGDASRPDHATRLAPVQKCNALSSTC